MRILHQKNLDVPFWQVYECLKLCLLPVMYSTTSAVLHYPALQHQCRIVTCVAVPGMFYLVRVSVKR